MTPIAHDACPDDALRDATRVVQQRLLREAAQASHRFTIFLVASIAAAATLGAWTGWGIVALAHHSDVAARFCLPPN